MPFPQIHQEERRTPTITISPDMLEEIAEMAAAKAVKKLEDRMYQEIGKAILQKLSWLIGIVAVSVYLWVQKQGWLRL